MENESIKILLVEDNPFDIELIGGMLTSSSQFELVAIEQLDQALQRLNDEQFDVILLDISLPDSQGLDTFTKTYTQAPNVPIILLTGLDDETLAIQTVQAGAQDYLVKGQMDNHLLGRAIRYAVERQQLHLELKASESRLRAIIENNADGIMAVNRDGIVQFANPAAETLFGRSIDELVGKPFDFPMTTTEFTEFDIIRSGDQTVIVEMRIVETEREGESAYLVSLRDISWRKQTEKEIARLATVIEQADETIVITDLDGNIVYANPYFETSTGYTRAEVLGQNPRLLKSDQRDTAFYQELWDTIASGNTWTGVFINKRKDGSLYHEEATIFPIRDLAGDIINYAAVKKDVTERVRAEAALRESETRFRAVVETANDAIISIDSRGDIIFWNPGAETIFGYPADEIIGQSLTSIMPERFREAHHKGIQRLVSTGKPELLGKTIELMGLKKDGSEFPVELSLTIWQTDEKVFFTSIIRDITERKQAEEALQNKIQELKTAYEQAMVYAQELTKEIAERKRSDEALRRAYDELEIRVLERTMDLSRANEALQNEIKERKQAEAALRESEERYMLAAQGANDGLWDWDLQTNQVYFSSRWKSMLGYAEDEIGSNPDEWFDRVHPEDLGGVKTALTTHCEGDIPHFEYEHRMLHRDGTYRWMLNRGLAVRNAGGQVYRMAGSQTEITKRKRVEAKLVHDALYDALTDLPNRVFFVDRVRRSIKWAEAHADYLFAVLFLDLDRFKIVNDSLGHLVGDQLLIAVAQKLTECLRPSDIIARLGGDEFAILLDDIKDIDEAVQVANRIQKKMTPPFDLSGQTVFTTVSIGIILSTIGYIQPEEYLRDADTAMYQAKANGRARYEIFSRDMHASAMSLWQLEAGLRRAVERQEFQIHYQPIVSLTSGQITGAEALLRWEHPECGLLEPAEFMLLAEETGLIVPIGEWTLYQVCAQNKTWQTNGHSSMSVAVNLSARQFQHQDLPDLIKRVLHQTGLSTQGLVLEITESVATKKIDPNLATLHELSAMGIKISIDDFGIGSALDCLKRFPLNNLKVDQSFVRDIISDRDSATITGKIIDMAHSLNLTVIAEGVETEEQLAFLRSHQCDQIQGYLFSRPMPAEAFTELLQQGWHLSFKTAPLN